MEQKYMMGLLQTVIIETMPLSALFQLYHGNQFKWWRKPEYLERTTEPGQATGKLYHLQLRVECTQVYLILGVKYFGAWVAQ
jgi:hypothetical protein